MTANLPQARLPISEDGQTFSLPWLRFFQGLSSGSIDPAVIAALEAEIAAAEAAAALAKTIAEEALAIAEEAEAGITDNYGIVFAALDEPYQPSTPSQIAIMMGLQGNDGEDGQPGPPGQPGQAGTNGTIGRDGLMGMPGWDGEEGPIGMSVPGPIGPQGPTGSSGALVRISQIVTSASQTTIDFTSISGTFTNLKVVFFGRSQAGATTDNIAINFNGDNAAHYQQSSFFNNGTATPVASGQTSVSAPLINVIAGASATANYPGASETIIFGYAGTIFQKTAITTFQGSIAPGTQQSGITAIQWNSTATITRVTLFMNNAFVNGSVATLYGEL